MRRCAASQQPQRTQQVASRASTMLDSWRWDVGCLSTTRPRALADRRGALCRRCKRPQACVRGEATRRRACARETHPASFARGTPAHRCCTYQGSTSARLHDRATRYTRRRAMSRVDSSSSPNRRARHAVYHAHHRLLLFQPRWTNAETRAQGPRSHRARRSPPFHTLFAFALCVGLCVGPLSSKRGHQPALLTEGHGGKAPCSGLHDAGGGYGCGRVASPSSGAPRWRSHLFKTYPKAQGGTGLHQALWSATGHSAAQQHVEAPSALEPKGASSSTWQGSGVFFSGNRHGPAAPEHLMHL